MKREENEQAEVTDANRRISRGDEEQETMTSSGGDAADDVTRANQAISRGEERQSEGSTEADRALLNPPD